MKSRYSRILITNHAAPQKLRPNGAIQIYYYY